VTNLSKKSEEAFSRGVHENKFIFGFGIGTIGIEAEQNLSFGIVDDEAITGEEQRGLVDCELSLSREAEFLIHNYNLIHIHHTFKKKKKKLLFEWQSRARIEIGRNRQISSGH
jgi:hypothetical protein